MTLTGFHPRESGKNRKKRVRSPNLGERWVERNGKRIRRDGIAHAYLLPLETNPKEFGMFL